jgi:hypothetical protein
MTTATKSNGKTTATKVVKEEKFEPIILKTLEKATVQVQIVGVSPVIPHRWTEKARRMMLDKQQGKAVGKHPPKDPTQESIDSCYWLDGQPAIPAVSFKGAIADAARFFDKSVTIELLKRVIYVHGEGPDQLVPIEGDLSIYEAMPRNSSGVADLRYRTMISNWSTTLTINFMRSMLTNETLVTLVDAAGWNGVGDWRPSSPKSKTGTYGRFEVANG